MGNCWRYPVRVSCAVTREEFLLALKYIALEQVGAELMRENLRVPTELPVFAAPDGSDEDDEEPDTGGGGGGGGGGDTYQNVAPMDIPTIVIAPDQLDHYTDLWDEAKEGASECVHAGVAVSFFKSSGLTNGVLRTIWNISDFVEPQGQLSKDEFFVALKLIAVAVAGNEPSEENLSIAAPPPYIGTKKAPAAVAYPSEPKKEETAPEPTLTPPAPITLPGKLPGTLDFAASLNAKLGSPPISPGASKPTPTASPKPAQKMAFMASLNASLNIPMGMPGMSRTPPQARKAAEPEPGSEDLDDMFGGMGGTRDRLQSEAALSKLSVAKANKRRAPSRRGRGAAPGASAPSTPSKAAAAATSTTPKKAAPAPKPKPKKKKPVPVPSKKPAHVLSAVATELGLSSSDVDAYTKLWAAADTVNDLFPAGAAVKFLGTSGLPQETLRAIWGMSDTDAPRGQLDKDGFFKACKLIALVRQLQPFSFGPFLADFSAPQHLPRRVIYST